MARVDGKTVPTLPTNLKRRIPDRNFWRSAATKDAVAAITIAPYQGFNSLHFPRSMAKLPNVEVIRNWGCKLDKWLPLPKRRVKTWITWPFDTGSFPTVPDWVEERLVINTRGLKVNAWMNSFNRPYSILEPELEIVVIMGHNCMTEDTGHTYRVHHGDNDSPWVDFCEEKRNFIWALAQRFTSYPARSGRPTFTLVGFDFHLAQHWPTNGGMPEGLISDISNPENYPLWGSRLSLDQAERHIQFFTLDEYRNVVGEERFLLETTPPPAIDS